ncbi:VOC family protein [Macrococcus caseolyticus]|uniref:VOC family protein n=1 Tax=Macrococcoides caseolyticum TaxID=69966 RepID=UPI0011A776BA|nr:VOC family protein [Macrococcus caseolyticus]MDJ1088417.1 VOC family protein [Macrococcus caseolyticus]MDJ1091100.1 VOC family protein [Macrococcus caseolyticus]MDJ1153712.1 VOC family protein [Macrococcus caseolyticus]MEB8170866.1 VOC family protein [Macrococcus caseolyticus]
MQTNGLHHVTVITHDIQRFYTFYNKVLGLKLLKETENIENTAMKNLYFGDNKGNAGTLLSVIEVANPLSIKYTTDEIYAYSLRVPTDYSLYVFKLRFDEMNIKYDTVIKLNGRHALPFYDCDGRCVYLISDEHNKGIPLGEPDDDSNVDAIHQILGLGPVLINVSEQLLTSSILTQVLDLKHTSSYQLAAHGNGVQVFTSGDGGSGGEIHVVQGAVSEKKHSANIEQVGLSVTEEVLSEYKKRLESINIPHSEISDRKFYKTLFFKDPCGIVFELSTKPDFNL